MTDGKNITALNAIPLSANSEYKYAVMLPKITPITESKKGTVTTPNIEVPKTAKTIKTAIDRKNELKRIFENLSVFLKSIKSVINPAEKSVKFLYFPTEIMPKIIPAKNTAKLIIKSLFLNKTSVNLNRLKFKTFPLCIINTFLSVKYMQK